MRTVRFLWRALRRVSLVEWMMALAAGWLWQAAALVAFRKGEYGLINFSQDLSWWQIGGTIAGVAAVLIAAAILRPQWKVPARAAVVGGWMLCLWLAFRADVSTRMYLFLALCAVWSDFVNDFCFVVIGKTVAAGI